MHIENRKLILTPHDFPLELEVQDHREKRPPKYSMIYTKKHKVQIVKPNIRIHNPQH